MQKLNCLSKFNHKQDVEHRKVLLWCRFVEGCDYINAAPQTIHHRSRQASHKSQHYTDHTAVCQSTEVLEPPAKLKRPSSARWSRCASTSCCALMASAQSAAQCVHQAESWTKTKWHQQTSQADPKHVRQSGCWSQTRAVICYLSKTWIPFFCLSYDRTQSWLGSHKWAEILFSGLWNSSAGTLGCFIDNLLKFFWGGL